MKDQSKYFFYRLMTLLFQWSLVYVLVLFFLEDVKPFLVSSIFSPHWLVTVVVLSGLGMITTGQHVSGTLSSAIKKLSRLEIVLLRVSAGAVGLMWFLFWRSDSLITAIVLGCVIGYSVYAGALKLQTAITRKANKFQY